MNKRRRYKAKARRAAEKAKTPRKYWDLRPVEVRLTSRIMRGMVLVGEPVYKVYTDPSVINRWVKEGRVTY